MALFKQWLKEILFPCFHYGLTVAINITIILSFSSTLDVLSLSSPLPIVSKTPFLRYGPYEPHHLLEETIILLGL